MFTVHIPTTFMHAICADSHMGENEFVEYVFSSTVMPNKEKSPHLICECGEKKNSIIKLKLYCRRIGREKYAIYANSNQILNANVKFAAMKSTAAIKKTQ